MLWMLLFSDRQKGCPVSVLRQLVHYAVQVRGRQIFYLWHHSLNKKIVFITAKKLIYSLFFAFAFGILPLPNWCFLAYCYHVLCYLRVWV